MAVRLQSDFRPCRSTQFKLPAKTFKSLGSECTVGLWPPFFKRKVKELGGGGCHEHTVYLLSICVVCMGAHSAWIGVTFAMFCSESVSRFLISFTFLFIIYNSLILSSKLINTLVHFKFKKPLFFWHKVKDKAGKTCRVPNMVPDPCWCLTGLRRRRGTDSPQSLVLARKTYVIRGVLAACKEQSPPTLSGQPHSALYKAGLWPLATWIWLVPGHVPMAYLVAPGSLPAWAASKMFLPWRWEN